MVFLGLQKVPHEQHRSHSRDGSLALGEALSDEEIDEMMRNADVETVEA